MSDLQVSSDRILSPVEPVEPVEPDHRKVEQTTAQRDKERRMMKEERRMMKEER